MKSVIGRRSAPPCSEDKCDQQARGDAMPLFPVASPVWDKDAIEKMCSDVAKALRTDGNDVIAVVALVRRQAEPASGGQNADEIDTSKLAPRKSRGSVAKCERGYRRWSSAESASLVRMYADGVPFSDIMAKLGRSYCSVQTRLSHLRGAVDKKSEEAK